MKECLVPYKHSSKILLSESNFNIHSLLALSLVVNKGKYVEKLAAKWQIHLQF